MRRRGEGEEGRSGEWGSEDLRARGREMRGREAEGPKLQSHGKSSNGQRSHVFLEVRKDKIRWESEMS